MKHKKFKNKEEIFLKTFKNNSNTSTTNSKMNDKKDINIHITENNKFLISFDNNFFINTKNINTLNSFKNHKKHDILKEIKNNDNTFIDKSLNKKEKKLKNNFLNNYILSLRKNNNIFLITIFVSIITSIILICISSISINDFAIYKKNGHLLTKKLKNNDGTYPINLYDLYKTFDSPSSCKKYENNSHYAFAPNNLLFNSKNSNSPLIISAIHGFKKDKIKTSIYYFDWYKIFNIIKFGNFDSLQLYFPSSDFDYSGTLTPQKVLVKNYIDNNKYTSFKELKNDPNFAIAIKNYKSTTTNKDSLYICNLYVSMYNTYNRASNSWDQNSTVDKYILYPLVKNIIILLIIIIFLILSFLLTILTFMKMKKRNNSLSA